MVFVVLRQKNSIEGPPSSEECPDRPIIDINTLGFAGTIAAKNQLSYDFLKSFGPVNCLREVAK